MPVTGRSWALAGFLLGAPSVALGGSGAGPVLGLAAVRVGSGEHQVRPTLGGFGRLGTGGPCFAELEVAANRRLEGGELVRFDERWGRAALGLGCTAGRRAVQVGLALGPALTVRQAVVQADATWSPVALEAGLRYRLGADIPLGRHWSLGLWAGGSTRGRSHDQDLLVEVGPRW